MTKDPLPFCVCATPKLQALSAYCSECQKPLPPQGEKCCPNISGGAHWRDCPVYGHKESSVKEEIRFGDSLVIAHAGKETPVEGDWETDLQFGVMEDYLLEAAARDSESKYFGEHLERMRGHFENLKDWIRLHLAEERQRGRDEAIENIKEIAVQGITTGLGVKLYEISEQGLESAKSPREGAEGK